MRSVPGSAPRDSNRRLQDFSRTRAPTRQEYPGRIARSHANHRFAFHSFRPGTRPEFEFPHQTQPDAGNRKELHPAIARSANRENGCSRYWQSSWRRAVKPRIAALRLVDKTPLRKPLISTKFGSDCAGTCFELQPEASCINSDLMLPKWRRLLKVSKKTNFSTL